jgi:hypothetical protein
MTEFYPSSRDNDKAVLATMGKKLPISFVDAMAESLNGPSGRSMHARLCFVCQHFVRNIDRTTGRIVRIASPGDPFTTSLRAPLSGFRIDGAYIGDDPVRPANDNAFIGLGEDIVKMILNFVVSDDMSMAVPCRLVCRAWNNLGKFCKSGVVKLAEYTRQFGDEASPRALAENIARLLRLCNLDASGVVVPWMIHNDASMAMYASLVLFSITEPIMVDGQRAVVVRALNGDPAIFVRTTDGLIESSPCPLRIKSNFCKLIMENDVATAAVKMALETVWRSNPNETRILKLDSLTFKGGSYDITIEPGLRKLSLGINISFSTYVTPHRHTLVDLHVICSIPIGGEWPALRRLTVDMEYSGPTQAIAPGAVMPKLRDVTLHGIARSPLLDNIPTGITSLELTGPFNCTQIGNRYLKTADLGRFTKLQRLIMSGVCKTHNTDLTNALRRMPDLQEYQNVLACRCRAKRDNPECMGADGLYNLLLDRCTDTVEARRSGTLDRWKPATTPLHRSMLREGDKLPNDGGRYQRGYTVAGAKAAVFRHPGGLVTYKTTTCEYEVRWAPKLTLRVTPRCVSGIESILVQYRHLIKSLVLIRTRDSDRRKFGASGPYHQLRPILSFD